MNLRSIAVFLHGGGSSLVFRVEAGRSAGLTMEHHGQALGGEMLRVP